MTAPGRTGIRLGLWPAQSLPRVLRRADRPALHRRRGGQRQRDLQRRNRPGRRGANYGWPDSEGHCSAPCTSPLYDYAHNGPDAAITGGFVYHGTQFPSSMQGNYFFADYAQHWIKRLTFDANGNVNGVFNFEPTAASRTAVGISST